MWHFGGKKYGEFWKWDHLWEQKISPPLHYILQALFLCNICEVLGLFWHFEICFLSTPRQMPQTITNITRCPPQILTVPKFWYHLAHSFSRKNVPFDFERAFWEAEGALPKPKGPFFRENEAQEMTPKLLALAKVCSVLGNIRDVSWHLSKRGSELEKKVNIFHFGQKQCAQK